MFLHINHVNTGAKKREYQKLCRFVTFFVVQVNHCDCKVCVFTPNVSVTLINYIMYLEVTSRDIYPLKTKLNRKSNMASVQFIGRTT